MNKKQSNTKEGILRELDLVIYLMLKWSISIDNRIEYLVECRYFLGNIHSILEFILLFLPSEDSIMESLKINERF